MSGQPYNTRLDVATARNAYLANLKLRAELDDKNLQANKVYIRTGQLPTQPSDTRSLTEKLADVQRLKIEIRGKLSSITDGAEANKIAETLSPDELVFLSQNWKPIQEQMKKSYAVGVLAPIFVDYLRKFIGNFNESLGIETGLQQSGVKQMIANQQTIINDMVSRQELGEIYNLIQTLGYDRSSVGRSIVDSLRSIQDVVDILPVAIQQIGDANNSIEKTQMLTTLNNLVEQLPTRDDLSRTIATAESMKKSRDIQGLTMTLEKLDEILGSGGDIREEMAILRQLISESKSGSAMEFEDILAPTTAQAEFVEQPIAQASVSAEKTPQQLQIINNYNAIDSGQISSIPSLKAYIDKMYPFVGQELRISKNAWIRSLGFDRPYGNLGKFELNEIATQLNSLLREKAGIPPSATGNGFVSKGTIAKAVKGIKGMKGKGLSVRKNSGSIIEGDVDYGAGIMEQTKFIPIGRYLINKRQLERDIIAIKRPKGSIIAGLPSQRVSNKLGGVIRKILGGSIPSFEDFNDLDDGEKVFLNKVKYKVKYINIL